MITEILTSKVQNDTLWHAADMTDESRWLYVLTDDDRGELLQALEKARQKRCDPAHIHPGDYPLPRFSATLGDIGRRLDTGTGFRILRGLPIRELSRADLELLYAGLTSHLGEMINQDTRGTLIEPVYDKGRSYDSSIAVRGYTTNAQLTPHCDSGDLVALLCVRPAMSGGVNNLSCAMAIYNAILDTRPEFLEPLYRGFYYNIRGNGPVGPYQDITSHRVPVFSYHRNTLSIRYNQKAMLTAEQLPGVPSLTDLEKAAIDYVAELAMRDDIRFDLDLEAGDLALLNNNTVLHNRSRFVDHEAPDKKRLLLRQWVNLYEARELARDFADHYNTGPRKGPAIHAPAKGPAIHAPAEESFALMSVK